MSEIPVIQRLKCQLCGYTWYPREPGRRPAACPDCRRRKWDKTPNLGTPVAEVGKEEKA